ncbi:uncharacterized protein LOC118409020 [Branchiostoma floridae]|uniref:Uncharacterized protein LOC118409020 n=1 Tax=Branchiostoma floridae TaxID=7739 RepID=A0A9J7KCW8_BRAFL|nr:uncharacterized protein LOC118409020 [Branchiostoma floridae]
MLCRGKGLGIEHTMTCVLTRVSTPDQNGVMSSPPVLRADATLVNRSILPLLRELRKPDGPPEEDQLARFEAETPLSAYNAGEIAARIGALTGEPPEDLMEMAGMDPKAEASMRKLAHCAILAANNITAAQPIKQDKASRDAAQAAVGLVEDDPSTSEDGPSTSGLGRKDGKRPATAPPKAAPGRQGKKSKRDPASSSESDSDDDDMEDDEVECQLRRVKRVCQDPFIHLYPARLQNAVRRLVRAAKEAGHKRLSRFKVVQGFLAGTAASPTIGKHVGKMLMTKEELRFSASQVYLSLCTATTSGASFVEARCCLPGVPSP